MAHIISLLRHYVTNLSSTNCYFVLLLCCVAIAGDYFVSHVKRNIFQAAFDNATHAIIGGLSWLLVCANSDHETAISEILTEAAATSVIASVIDLDHFVAAKSIYLKDATNLQKRPLLHCTSFPVIICLLLLVFSFLIQSLALKKGALIVLTAFFSHHTRDATRRGYWCYPFGSTPPISYNLYIAITCLFPYVVLFLHNSVRIRQRVLLSKGDFVV